MLQAIIIIPCYNRIELTINTIESIRQTSDTKIIAVDDGSTDNTYNVLKSKVDIILRHGTNLGVAKAFNSGLERAVKLDYKYFIKVDNDIKFLKSGWVEKLVQAVDREDVGLSAVKIQLARGRLRNVGDGLLDTVTNLNGACLCISKKTFNILGYAYECFPANYGFLDADYCLRCRIAKLKTVYLAEDGLAVQQNGNRPEYAKYERWKTSCRRRNTGRWRKYKNDLLKGIVPISCHNPRISLVQDESLQLTHLSFPEQNLTSQ